eukprot:3152425-Alexandrium_andersonii.AAC.1
MAHDTMLRPCCNSCGVQVDVPRRTDLYASSLSAAFVIAEFVLSSADKAARAWAMAFLFLGVRAARL